MKRRGLPPVDPEQRRRINENLIAIREGRAQREQEARKAERAEKKRLKREAAKQIKKAKYRLAVVELERDDLQKYMDELLLREDPNPLGYAEGMDDQQYQGLLEEVDSALEGCNKEIGDLLDELETLRSI